MIEFKRNGRTRYFNRITSVTKTGTATWIAVRNGVEYRIEGGKKAGGSARDWFLDAPGWIKSINCTSLVDALNVVENM